MLGVGIGISLRFRSLAGGGTTPTETYYVTVAGTRILAGTDLITVGVP
jgi:hypothetical protein